MISCGRARHRIQLYVDGELQPPALLELEEHLLSCARCRAAYEELRAVVDVVRGAQPLYDVPRASLRNARSIVARRRPSWKRALAAAIPIVVLAVWLAWPSGGEFTAFAADTHRRHASGAMPLDITSSDPRAVSGWLSARLPFALHLPNHAEAPGEPKRYRLAGARLLQYQNRDVAYLAYEMDGKPISLLMSSEAFAAPSGGSVYRSGELAFHCFSFKELSVIAWTDRGIHYSLVSGITAPRGESCIICHGQAGHQKSIGDLRPGPRPARTTDRLPAAPAGSARWK